MVQRFGCSPSLSCSREFTGVPIKGSAKWLAKRFLWNPRSEPVAGAHEQLELELELEELMMQRTYRMLRGPELELDCGWKWRLNPSGCLISHPPSIASLSESRFRDSGV
jgi:hypothetical protein